MERDVRTPHAGTSGDGMRSARLDRGALSDGIPLFVPAVPFGFVVGVAVVESEMPMGVGWSTSITIFAGASQLATVTLAGVATLWAVAVAALVINSRHVMYSAALAPTFRAQPRWFRWVAPFLLIDQVFALAVYRADDPPAAFRRYYLTLGVFFYLSWLAAVSLGMVVGPFVPTSWRLDVAPAVMFTGMVVLAANRSPAIVAAVVAGGVGFAAAGLPDRLGILVGAMAGVVAGAVAEGRRRDDAITAGEPSGSIAAGDAGDSTRPPGPSGPGPAELGGGAR